MKEINTFLSTLIKNYSQQGWMGKFVIPSLFLLVICFLCSVTISLFSSRNAATITPSPVVLPSQGSRGNSNAFVQLWTGDVYAIPYSGPANSVSYFYAATDSHNHGDLYPILTDWYGYAFPYGNRDGGSLAYEPATRNGYRDERRVCRDHRCGQTC